MFVEPGVQAGSRSSASYGRGASFALFVRDMPDDVRRTPWAWVGCLLVRHDVLMIRAPGRSWPRCTDCGRDTPGWRVGRGPAPTIASHGRRPIQHARREAESPWRGRRRIWGIRECLSATNILKQADAVARLQGGSVRERMPRTAFLGSTTHHVIREARCCSVLVIRG
jgi:hypothetical protein